VESASVVLPLRFSFQPFKVSRHWPKNVVAPSLRHHGSAKSLPTRQQLILSSSYGRVVCTHALHANYPMHLSSLKLAILTSCHVPFHAASHVACLRIDGPFARTGPGTWGWDRRMFQELFGLFTNSATVDNVVERLGQVRALPSCPPPPHWSSTL